MVDISLETLEASKSGWRWRTGGSERQHRKFSASTIIALKVLRSSSFINLLQEESSKSNNSLWRISLPVFVSLNTTDPCPFNGIVRIIYYLRLTNQHPRLHSIGLSHGELRQRKVPLHPSDHMDSEIALDTETQLNVQEEEEKKMTIGFVVHRFET